MAWPAGAHQSAKTTSFPWLALALAMACVTACVFPDRARAQSPELLMREFSSAQIKKGVRSIGFGGDGATWGNYGLVWQDANTALVDYGNTSYTNGNDFQFSAVGFTSPSLWHDLAIYVVAMSQTTNHVQFNAAVPGLGPGPVRMTGTGSDNAVFSKIAMPLGNGFSAGVLLAHETSEFDAMTENSNQAVRWQTEWRPSGGFGLAWQPSNTMLFGFRALLNNDLERRSDAAGTTEGMASTQEYRLGGSISPWTGAWVDIGVTNLERQNALAGTRTNAFYPNLGFEQALLDRRVVVRFGLDEESPTAGISFKFNPFRLDVAYVCDMARSRVGDFFGTNSSSIVATLTLDYGGESGQSRSASRNDLFHDRDFLPPVISK